MIPSDSLIQSILLILSGGAQTGYQIGCGLSRMGQTCSAEELYPALHALEKNGLVRSNIVDISPIQERRFYRLTPKGRLNVPRDRISVPPCSAINPEPANDTALSIRLIRFRRWCSDAVIGIRVSPDREIVSRELFGHLYDCFCGQISMGLSADEAERRAFAAAGNARNLSASLARLHKPFWTRALRITRRMIAVLAVIVCFTYSLYYLNTRFFSPSVEKFDADAGPGIAGTHVLISTLESDASAKSDGYSLHVSRAELWQTSDTDSSGNLRQRTLLNVQIRCFNPLPWANVPRMEGWIWAEDSLGNYYYCSQEDSLALEPSVSAAVYQTGMLGYTVNLWIYQFVSQDAQWIDFHYDRSGRDIVFRIDLTGGDQP